MDQKLMMNVVVAIGLIGTIAGVLIILQIPSANQYHETTLSAAGVGVLLFLFGIKTLAESVVDW
jgi:uncharacterized membrane protein YccC